jgi:8-oxo-dGTP pyrophosphatase MutT (NUDIX family)
LTDTPAIPAATLILVRDRPDSPPEVLMVERAAAMAFAAGAMVFPGGRIDAEDKALGVELGVPHGSAIVASIRETLEETAIPVALDPLPSADLALALQQDLLAGRPFAALLKQHHLRLVAGALQPFAHWIPKFHAVRRFDTRFFLARAPEGPWEPIVGERENRTAEWATAADILRRDAAGQATLIFPTRCNLQRLAQHGSVAEIVDDARRHPVEPITPWVEEHDGEKLLTIPPHLGYPQTQERLDSLWRG